MCLWFHTFEIRAKPGLSKTYAHMDERKRQGQGKGREETYFEMIVFLSRRGRLHPHWSLEYSWRPGTVAVSNGFSLGQNPPSGAPRGREQGGTAAGGIWRHSPWRDSLRRAACPAHSVDPRGRPLLLAGDLRVEAGSSGARIARPRRKGAPVSARA